MGGGQTKYENKQKAEGMNEQKTNKETKTVKQKTKTKQKLPKKKSTWIYIKYNKVDLNYDMNSYGYAVLYNLYA